MQSSKYLRGALVALGALADLSVASSALAQRPIQGFGVERFYSSAPGGGWFVMDTLDMHGGQSTSLGGGLGGAAEFTTGYAHNPLRIASSDGSQHLSVVSDEAFADFGFAATYQRVRLYVNFTAPLLVKGDANGNGNGVVIGDDRFTSPTSDLGSRPDTLSDVRLGFDTRVVGESDSAFRLGVGAQLFIPSGTREDYVSDHTYRAMGRVLVAGDHGHFTYAGHVGLHIRPLDNAPTAGSPQGGEFLFGAAAGARFSMCGPCCYTQMVIGPEVYGTTALDGFFGTTSTALEGLMSARIEGTSDEKPQMRFKLGAGGGLNPHFGAPDARVVFAIEVFSRKLR